LNSLNLDFNTPASAKANAKNNFIMKKIGFFILAFVIFAIIVYVTFIIAVIEIIVGAVLFVIAAIALIILWNKLKNKIEDEF
jgi:protein-S-isoprenylcysteine O-methyltransferase Ste14